MSLPNNCPYVNVNDPPETTVNGPSLTATGAVLTGVVSDSPIDKIVTWVAYPDSWSPVTALMKPWDASSLKSS